MWWSCGTLLQYAPLGSTAAVSHGPQFFCLQLWRVFPVWRQGIHYIASQPRLLDKIHKINRCSSSNVSWRSCSTNAAALMDIGVLVHQTTDSRLPSIWTSVSILVLRVVFSKKNIKVWEIGILNAIFCQLQLAFANMAR